MRETSGGGNQVANKPKVLPPGASTDIVAPGGGGGNQLGTKPAQVPGQPMDNMTGGGLQAPPSGNQAVLDVMPDWMGSFMRQNPEQAVQWARNNPERGGAQNILAAARQNVAASMPGGGPTAPPGIMGGAAGQMTPEESWVSQNMPNWMRERGIDSQQALKFIQNHPGSGLAQMFQEAGFA